MYLAYFDENKFCKENPFFTIGGFLLEEKKADQLDKTLTQIQYNFFETSIMNKDTEFHGKDIFHGKNSFKGRTIKDRLKVFDDMANVIINNSIPIRLIRIDVEAHRAKYSYPEPEYKLGLMLVLERFCDYLDHVSSKAIVFGDYDQQEAPKSILDFSQFKFHGKTPMYFGRPLGRIIDTIYFTHSHHSRFLQLADIIIYLAGRFEKFMGNKISWHEKQEMEIWEKIKASTDFKIQNWP